MDSKTLIKDKDIVIVGPSPALRDCNLGLFIDSFDCVARVNSAVPDLVSTYSNDYGKKTDILYHTWCDTTKRLTPELYRDNYKVQVIKTLPLILPYQENYTMTLKDLFKNILPVEEIYIDTYNYISDRMRTRPTTGLLAIYDILSHNPKSLSVYGFTFDYTYCDRYTNNVGYDVHDYLNDLAVFKHLISIHNNIKCDDALLKRLESSLEAALINPSG